MVEGETRREKLNSLYKIYNSVDKATSFSKGIRKRIRQEEGADESDDEILPIVRDKALEKNFSAYKLSQVKKR